MKEADLLKKVLEESLKEDPERDENTLSAIKEKIRQEEEKEEDEHKTLPAPPHAFGGRWKHFTAAALSVAVVAVCLVVTLFSMEKPPQEHYYAAADYERTLVANDYDFSSLYEGNLSFSGYEVDRAYIYQTKAEPPEIISIELNYLEGATRFAFELYIFLVENYEFENEDRYDPATFNKTMEIEINDEPFSVSYLELSTPNDASGGALETVSQMTKFKVDSFTYYMSVDSIRIVGEDTNQLAELIGQMF